jgi:hypothetical protein
VAIRGTRTQHHGARFVVRVAQAFNSAFAVRVAGGMRIQAVGTAVDADGTLAALTTVPKTTLLRAMAVMNGTAGPRPDRRKASGRRQAQSDGTPTDTDEPTDDAEGADAGSRTVIAVPPVADLVRVLTNVRYAFFFRPATAVAQMLRDVFTPTVALPEAVLQPCRALAVCGHTGDRPASQTGTGSSWNVFLGVARRVATRRCGQCDDAFRSAGRATVGALVAHAKEAGGPLPLAAARVQLLWCQWELHGGARFPQLTVSDNLVVLATQAGVALDSLITQRAGGSLGAPGA